MALAYAASTFRLHFGICVAQPYLILSLQSPSTAVIPALLTPMLHHSLTSKISHVAWPNLILGIAMITFESKFFRWITLKKWLHLYLYNI